MTPVINWDSETWGQPGFNVHVSSDVNDAHDVAEAAAEARRA